MICETYLENKKLKELYKSGEITLDQALVYISQLTEGLEITKESLMYVIINIQTAYIAFVKGDHNGAFLWLEGLLSMPGLIPDTEDLKLSPEEFYKKNII